MVEDCQNVEPEKKFVNNLLSLAKELDKLSRTREFKKEFENEKPNFPFKMSTNDAKVDNYEGKNEINDDSNECLKMEVYDDKDYDIEEIKFWNFISKNKGVKPSVIRTIVYKVPESSYIVKKVPVIIDEPEVKTFTDKDKKEQKTTLCEATKENIVGINNQENKTIETEKPTPVALSEVKKSIASQPKTNEPVKFSSEDIIVIEEDDDIIGFDDENDEKEEKKETIKSEEICQDEERNLIEEEDDDIIEEEVIQHKEQNEKVSEPIENNEDEKNEINNEISVDKKLGLLQKSIQIQKRHRRTKLMLNRPKVVIEKANEPASTISVKKSSETNAKTVTRSKGNSSNLNKSLPIITQSKAAVTRKSLNLRTESKKLPNQLDIANSVSSSSSNVSTTSSSVLNNLTIEPSRVTRSKAKLKDNSK